MHRIIMFLIALLLSLILPLTLTAQDPLFEKTIDSTSEALLQEEATLVVENLMGSLVIEQGEQEKLESRIVVHGFSQEEERAKKLAEKCRLEVVNEPNLLKLRVHYPVAEHSIYYYPNKDRGHGRRVTAQKSKLRLTYQEKDVTVVGDKSPTATYLFADLYIKLPKTVKERTLILSQQIGDIALKRLHANTTIDTSLANVLTTTCAGDYRIQNNMGNVECIGHKGVLSILTNLGKVELIDCFGKATLESSSGNITVKNSEMENCFVRTGTGPITFDDTTANVEVFTGSGKVYFDDFVAKKELLVTTGSGSVRGKGDFSKVTALRIFTGSGSIALTSKPFPNLNFDITTGAGSIVMQAPGIAKAVNFSKTFKTADNSETTGIGTIRTGSGSVRLEGAKQKQGKKQKN